MCYDNADILVKSALGAKEIYWEKSGGGWATSAVLSFLFALWISAFFFRCSTSNRLPSSSRASIESFAATVSLIIADVDLKDLIEQLEGKLNESEKWENVIEKTNDLFSYSAKCCRSKQKPMKYLSITTFKKCSSELLRDFYMDNEYRKDWDKTIIEQKQLQIDEVNGIEIARIIKKFPLFTPREYVLAWRVWEGKDKVYYCIVVDCDHPQAPRQPKYVRVQNYRSGWCIKNVPGKYACEIRMLHQEDSGMNAEMAKLAFTKGIWSYVSKMNSALRHYSSLDSRCSISVENLHRLLKKVPSELEAVRGQPSPDKLESLSRNNSIGERQYGTKALKSQCCLGSKWIHGLSVLGGIVYLSCVCSSSSSSPLGARVAMACIMKKLLTKQHSTEAAVFR